MRGSTPDRIASDGKSSAQAGLALAVAGSLCLAACQTTEERLIGEAAAEEANAELLTNCELTGATLTSSRTRYRLALPTALYAAREQAPVAGRIACMTHWAREHGVTLTIVDAGAR